MGTQPNRMDKKDFQKIYNEYLTNEGYKPEINSDGDVSFKKEGWLYVIIIDEKDEHYFRVCLPNIWQIESEEERVRVLTACDRANAKIKVVKLTTASNTVWAAAELFFGNPGDFKAVFERSLSVIQRGRTVFAELMQEGQAKARQTSVEK